MATTGYRGGKRSGALLKPGYYGKDTAGQQHELKKKEFGTTRKFKGSGLIEFPFYAANGAIFTIPARSYEEAWRIAKRRGLKQRRGRK